MPSETRPSLWELCTYSEYLETPPVCVRAHHDDQQNVLEVVSEAQCGAAEQSKVSLQELQDGTQSHGLLKQTN